MKPNKKMGTVLLAIITLATHAHASKGAGNGGDSYARDFVAHGYRAMALAANKSVTEISLDAFTQALAKTVVRSEESLELRGEEVDAINYPNANPPEIIVSRKALDRLKVQEIDPVYLAFHEYLEIMGVDDSRYQVSANLDKTRVCQRTKYMRRILEDQTGKNCEDIDLDDLAKVSFIQMRLDLLMKGDLNSLVGLKEIQFVSRLPDPGNSNPYRPDMINEFPSGFFSDLNSLRNLTFDYVVVKSVKEGDFKGLNSLKRLVAKGPPSQSYAAFEKIDPAAFRDTPVLEFLSFEYTTLPQMQTRQFGELTNLKTLLFTMYDDAQREIPASFLDGLSGLDHFSMVTNQVNSIGKNAFIETTAHNVINLCSEHYSIFKHPNNPLAAVHPEAFAQVKNVGFLCLKLDGTTLSQKPSETFGFLSHLKPAKSDSVLKLGLMNADKLSPRAFEYLADMPLAQNLHITLFDKSVSTEQLKPLLLNLKSATLKGDSIRRIGDLLDAGLKCKLDDIIECKR